MLKSRLHNDGLIQVGSAYSFAETVNRLEQAIRVHGMTLFAHIDFSGDAEQAGLKMQPAQLLIFGNPKGGTPLMVAAPTVAIDLPLKVLVWRDVDGAVRLTYNDPEYLRERHAIPEELLKNIAGISGLVRDVAGEKAP